MAPSCERGGRVVTERPDDPFVSSVLGRLDASPRGRRVLDRDARRAILAGIGFGALVLVWTFWPSSAVEPSPTSPGLASERDLQTVLSGLRVPEGKERPDETSTTSSR